MQFANNQQHVEEDTALRLDSRGVVSLTGAGALEMIKRSLIGFSRELDPESDKASMGFVLDADGFLRTELYIVPKDEGFLIDCPKDRIPALLDRVEAMCADIEANCSDVSNDWIVFAELPDQKTFDYGEPYIKYTDPRWHMGARVLRPKSPALHSSLWGSELKWANQAFKLGFLPHVGYLGDESITILEAGFHQVVTLDPEELPEDQRSQLANPGKELLRRVLPVRVEPTDGSFSTLTGKEIVSGDDRIGKVLGHYGLYAVGIIEIAPWRKALHERRVIDCDGQPVLITWPSWLAQESHGRGGPVALAS